ncbi:hypothetical protein Pla163_35000 [Planctomycetes bacterium Pla163]|uniref:VWFA domain-containing protein n=1 Tax=Rohdeia mirabilis TaxID=2528008 RepID=A0A518D4F6_9BACT|nr:hypothetical protein Pla163_35000 [Planctomycetes bacterium Pla163]
MLALLAGVLPVLSVVAIAPQEPLSETAWTTTGQLLHSYGYIGTPDGRSVFEVGEQGTIRLDTKMFLERPPGFDRFVRVVFFECSDAMADSQPSFLVDENGDGLAGTLLDAAVQSVVRDSEVGFDDSFDYPTSVGVFGATAALADMTAAPGFDLDDGYAQNKWSVVPVARSIGLPGPDPEIGLHTPIEVSGGANFESMLQLAVSRLSADTTADRQELVIFAASEATSLTSLSDELAALASLGVVVQCYGLGTNGAVLCSPAGTLGHIASSTGGTAEWIASGSLASFTQQPEEIVTFVAGAFGGCSDHSVGEWWQWGPCYDWNCYDPLWQGIGYWEHCLPYEGIDIAELPIGDYTWSWHATASDGTVAGGERTISIVPFIPPPPSIQRLLFIGLQPTSVPLSPVEADHLYVNPLVALDVLDGTSPEFLIPVIPGLQGTEVYFQVLIVDPTIGSSDALRTSNGIELEINAGAAKYGVGSGVFAWFDGSFKMGESFQILYWAPGFEDD